jgi:hypothetical protein
MISFAAVLAEDLRLTCCVASGCRPIVRNVLMVGRTMDGGRARSVPLPWRAQSDPVEHGELAE